MFEFLDSKDDTREEQVIFPDLKYHLTLKKLKRKFWSWTIVYICIKNNVMVIYSIHSLRVRSQNVQQSPYNHGF